MQEVRGRLKSFLKEMPFATAFIEAKRVSILGRLQQPAAGRRRRPQAAERWRAALARVVGVVVVKVVGFTKVDVQEVLVV